MPLRLRADAGRATEGSEAGRSCSTTLEVPLVEVLVELEFNGIKVDTERLARAERQVRRAAGELEQEIYELAGHEFNIGSPKQLQQVLFDELKLPVLKKTKTGPQHRRRSARRAGRSMHPLPAKIIEYRQYAKLKSTYVDALPQLIHPQTGRVHASFNQVVAATGRLSSQRSEPAKHSDPHRERPRNSLGVPARPAGLEAAGGRLFADRAARAGPFLRRRNAVRGLRARRRHSRPRGQPGLTACRWTKSLRRHAAQWPRRSTSA